MTESSPIFPLSNNKCYPTAAGKIAENCRILYAKFHVLFKNIQRKIAANFISAYAFSLALGNFICTKPNQKYLSILEYYSKGCSLANRGTRDPNVMQISLIARNALSGY